MKSRAKKRTIRLSDARNSRQVSFKYVPFDDDSGEAFPAGRCYKCNKITTDFCSGCDRFVCQNHFEKKEGIVWCVDCINKGIKRNKSFDYVG